MKNRLARSCLKRATVAEAARGLRSVYRYYRTGLDEDRERALTLMRDGDDGWTPSEIFQRLLFLQDGKLPDSINVRDWDVMFFEPLAFWTELSLPVLGIWGSDDINVPAEFSKNCIQSALGLAGNADYYLISYPNSGYGIPIENGPKGDFPRSAPGYVEQMRVWFREQAE
jgi:pimeloyl-ACP methyl ester carboxylesterase